MKVEKVLIDAICDCCLTNKSDTVRIEFDEDNIYTLCPTCVSRLVTAIKKVINQLDQNVPKNTLTNYSR